MATRQTYGGQRYNGGTEQRDQQSGDMLGQVRAATEAVGSQAEHVVTDYPLSSVLAVFAIGVGVGVVLGSAMFSSSHSSSNWFPSASSSHWFPSMSSNSSSWLPSSSNHSWFSNQGPNWSDSLMQGAKSMCGY